MSKLLKRLNDNQNKVTDTNGIMKLQAWDYGVAQDLTNKQITATIANAGGFLFDIDLVSNGTEIDLDFKDSQLQKLTPDTYFLEIKVTDKDGDVSVFPTEGYATFTINKNLHATEGALVPQITFDTVLADVKKAVDKKVTYYTSTIAKGDKGDKGDPGKDGVSPVIQTNHLFNSEFTPDLEGWSATNNDISYVGISKSVTVGGSNVLNITHSSNTNWSAYHQQISDFVAGDVVSASVYARQTAGNWTFAIDSYNSAGTRTIIKQVSVTTTNTLLKIENVTIPSDATKLYFSFWGNTAGTVAIYKPMLVFGSTVTNYIQGNYYPIDTLQSTPRLNGNNMYVGDNTYMGANTFMDGVTLSGKNVVNNIKDTDWLDIPLTEGRTGLAKYKVSLGKVFVHLDGITGVTATGNNAQGQIGTLPVNPSPYYTRYIALVSATTRGITIAPNGVIYVANAMGNTMSENDSYILDIVIM